MPLHDHFRPPLDDRHSWDAFHGLWPGMIVQTLFPHLPPEYTAEPTIHLGGGVEIDVGAVERRSLTGATAAGTATAAWTSAAPTLVADADEADPDEYEVNVYETSRGRRLVAAIEIVSPSNKDRPETRQAFAAKCATLVRQGVAVTIVDVVTDRSANLYADVLALLGQSDPTLATPPGPIYAAVCRRTRSMPRRYEAWYHPLAVGTTLPTLPLWLTADMVVPLELAASYEAACRLLRIA